ncbi:YARHG domain-containing protein [Lacrimispora sp. 210928-DFI.3.58]|nr:YARHG domain-containing protein [Lacrimispora sp. 210928-DFI.3.58]
MAGVFRWKPLLLASLAAVSISACKEVLPEETGRETSRSVRETAAEASPLPFSDGPMTKEELAELEKYLNRGDNYGFLLSDYDGPQEIDLEEVFYNGAGISREGLSEEETGAYLAAAGQSEFMTDLVCLSTGDLDAFLQKKTGCSLGSMRRGLSWLYLPEYDSYYTEHGDTNRRGIRCIKGEFSGDECRVWCLSDQYSQYNMESILTLKRTVEGVLFQSNQIIWDQWSFYKENASQPSAETLHFLVREYRREQGMGEESLDEPVFDSENRYYTEEELEDLSYYPGLFAIFRNELYARHGYLFESQSWNEFFSAYSWYDGRIPSNAFDVSCMNEYERENLRLAVELRK